ncbi:hypothetical protein PRIPAC_74118 [Pristionchus pacificus]|uniref:Uncharacterized protein n=1 Tax=Pristionchus pacificus TaxID=54126 RepID=A0A2A6BES7_PRIPA|nr:hypothetical protein PRIPAC_74118 [Pristionchus pacificus]|eukprot:PDM64389.1 hypothetical protein PRIPAC_52645 [Pristionchus pacificus]
MINFSEATSQMADASGNADINHRLSQAIASRREIFSVLERLCEANRQNWLHTISERDFVILTTRTLHLHTKEHARITVDSMSEAERGIARQFVVLSPLRNPNIDPESFDFHSERDVHSGLVLFRMEILPIFLEGASVRTAQTLNLHHVTLEAQLLSRIKAVYLLSAEDKEYFDNLSEKYADIDMIRNEYRLLD